MLVTDGDAEKAAALAKEGEQLTGRKVVVVLDRDVRLRERYNALWLPRLYVVDEHRKMGYVQPPERRLAVLVRPAGGLARVQAA